MATSLGIDFAAGKKRGKFIKAYARRLRLKKVKKRVSRVAKIKSAIKAKAKVIFTTGCMPAMIYGSEVTGINGFELKTLQTLALSTMTPSGQGRSREMCLLLNWDPVWRPATAPILQWVKACWKVATGAYVGRGTADIGALCKAWRELNEAGWPTWGAVRGPVGAYMASLKRIGWSSMDPLAIVDEHCTSRPILQLSPRLWGLFAKNAYFKQLELEVGKRFIGSEERVSLVT